MDHHESKRQPKDPASADHPRYTAKGFENPTVPIKKIGDKPVQANKTDTNGNTPAEHKKADKPHRPNLKRHLLLSEEELRIRKETGKNPVSDAEMQRRALEKALGPTLSGQLSRDPESLEAALNDSETYSTLIEMANDGDGAEVESNPDYQRVIRSRLGLPEWEHMDSRERGEQVLMRLTGDYYGYADQAAGGEIEDDDDDEDDDEEYDDDFEYDDSSFLRRKLRNAMGFVSVPLTRIYSRYFDMMESHRTKFQNMTEDEQIEHKKKWGKINTAIVPLGIAAIAATVAWKSGWLDHTFGSHHTGGAVPNPNDHNGKPGNNGNPGHDQLPGGPNGQMTDEQIRQWFNQAPDPALAPDKGHPHDFNHALNMPHDGNQAEFNNFKDTLKLQLKGNPRELAYYLSKMHAPGAPDPTDFNAVNKYGDYLMNNPQEHRNQFNLAANMLDGTKEWHTLSINQPYSSPYIQDGYVYQDDYVDYGGTYTQVTLENGTVLKIRLCGQPIELHEVVQHNAVQSAYAPQQGVNYLPQQGVNQQQPHSQSAPQSPPTNSSPPHSSYPPQQPPNYPPQHPTPPSHPTKGPTRLVTKPLGSGTFEPTPRIPAPSSARPIQIQRSIPIPRISGPTGSSGISRILSGMPRRP